MFKANQQTTKSNLVMPLKQYWRFFCMLVTSPDWPLENPNLRIFNSGCCKWIGRFLIQISLSILLGLGTQPRYESPNDLWVKTLINAVTRTGLVTQFPQSWLLHSQTVDNKMIGYLLIFFYNLCLLLFYILWKKIMYHQLGFGTQPH